MFGILFNCFTSPSQFLLDVFSVKFKFAAASKCRELRVSSSRRYICTHTAWPVGQLYFKFATTPYCSRRLAVAGSCFARHGCPPGSRKFRPGEQSLRSHSSFLSTLRKSVLSNSDHRPLLEHSHNKKGGYRLWLYFHKTGSV